MIYAIIQAVAIFFVPWLIIKNHKFFITKWIGTVGTAYLLGIIVSLVIFGLKKIGLNFTIDTDIGEISSHLAISIAIPLLLFSSNLSEAKKLSKTVLKSFVSLVISTVLVSSFAFYFYGRTIEFGGELSSMAAGLYTGGTPNLNAIGNIFGLDSTTIGVANLSDMIIGAVFYLFLLMLAKPILSKILKTSKNDKYLTSNSFVENTEELDENRFKLTRVLINRVILSFIIAVIGAIIGMVIWIILGSVQGRMNDYLVPSMMLTVTIGGIIFSFNKKIRKAKGMNVLGQYFILVFSFALASSLDFTRMHGIFSDILILYSIITVGVMIIHTLISKIMKLDVDCTIVTLTAGVYGPAFVPAITKQIKNDNLTVPGLIIGSLGYAIGTFLGMLLGLLFIV